MKRNILSEVLASVLVNAVYAMRNFPVVLINLLLTPLSFLIVISFVSHGALIGVAIEGAFIMTMVSNGIGLQGDLSHLKNDLKLQDMVVSSPTSAFTYMIGMALSEIMYALPSLIILSVLAVLFLNLGILAALVITAVLIMIFVVSLSLGFFLSTFTSDVIQSWAFSGMLSLLLSTLPPVYYPLTYIPLPYRYIAFISPTTYAAEIIQNITGFVSLSYSSVIIAWAVLLAFTIVLLFAAIKRSRWTDI
jgi:ABC-2 type transport system permease protein